MTLEKLSQLQKVISQQVREIGEGAEGILNTTVLAIQRNKKSWHGRPGDGTITSVWILTPHIMCCHGDAHSHSSVG